jgi:hypothetical protein
MKRHIVVLIVFASATVACGSSGSTSTPTGAETTAPSPTETPVSPLVGDWRRVNTCQDFVQAFKEAGFGEMIPQAVAGNGFVPGTAEQLAKKDRICEGARPRAHSHFFTEWGTFGSLDWRGEQVDDGTYEIVDDRTFVIGKSTFHFEIQGDEIMFDPVLEGCNVEFECGWMVAVALPGNSWERVA